MKQKLLFILIGLLGINQINAQFSVSPKPVKVAGQLRAATAGSLYFGYCDGGDFTGVGINSTAQLSAAICMPASFSGLYAGKTISKIRIGLNDNCTNVSVWIRSSLTGANLASQTVGNANKGWIEVTLSTPFTIPSNDFYIGYTATGNYQIGFSGQPVYDGCWLYNSQWDNVVNYGFGSLCIQALIDLQGTNVYATSLESLDQYAQAAPNQNFTIQASIKNYSSADITSVKAIYQVDNQTPVEKTISISAPIAPMNTSSINIPINVIASTGIYHLSVSIKEVNGQTNYFSDKSLTAEFKILSQPFPRKVVMEEGTGTWCGWCPRGAVGMALMKQEYPDTFIGIAVHNSTSDPMSVVAYDTYMTTTAQFFTGFPSAVLDRKTNLICDPYPDNGADYYFQSEITKTPVAGIQLTGGFYDANKKAITLRTVTTFGFSANNTNFRLAYVLIENGITGYSQANYYSYANHGTSSGPMGGYENKPDPMTDMVFNDVARGIYSDPAGIAGSIPSSVTGMTPLEHTYNINLPSTIKNINNLEVVVMLLNANTGAIENADKIEINGVYTDLPVLASDEVSVSVKDGQLFIRSADPVQGIDIYTISGQKILSQKTGSNTVSVDHLATGVYIVKVMTAKGEKVFRVII